MENLQLHKELAELHAQAFQASAVTGMLHSRDSPSVAVGSIGAARRTRSIEGRSGEIAAGDGANAAEYGSAALEAESQGRGNRAREGIQGKR